MFATSLIKSAYICLPPAVPVYDILTYLLYLNCVEIDSGLPFPSYRVSEFFLFFFLPPWNTWIFILTIIFPFSLWTTSKFFNFCSYPNLLTSGWSFYLLPCRIKLRLSDKMYKLAFAWCKAWQIVQSSSIYCLQCPFRTLTTHPTSPFCPERCSVCTDV